MNSYFKKTTLHYSIAPALLMGAKSRHRANLAVGYAAGFLDIARNNGAN